MNKNAIKKYATWARRELITRVAGRAAQYGVTEDGWGNADADSVDGRVLSDTEKKQRVAFINKVRLEGYEQAVEEVAYTWFNRFCALRYMEVNVYLPSHVRVFTNDAGEFKPQILDEALHLDLDGLNIEKVIALKENANQTEELFRYLLITQCNALSAILPGIFQKIEDYTELLLPENLLREGSVIERLITEIPEEDWTDQVQIIGWLYQYYIAEPKDTLINARRQYLDQDIPFVTQLFTSDWIVRYMVENSLGRLWMEGHPNEELKSNWKYYLDEAEQELEVEDQLAEIRKEYAALKPEDIKCIDPCCGSGHILVYMFDVLMQIYESYGYTPQEAVCSIVEYNLYGLDIDERAAQLAYFSVMMKARSYDKRFLNRHIQPHVYVIQESNALSKQWFETSDQLRFLFDIMHDAKEYGSMIIVPEMDFDMLRLQTQNCVKNITQYDIESQRLQNELPEILCMIDVAEVLAKKYHVVVTNPPYMNRSYMPGKIKRYVEENFSDFKSDLFAAFIYVSINLCHKNGYIGLLTPYVWMFISTYEKLRKWLYENANITTLVQLEYNAFEAACVPVVAFSLCKTNIKYSGEYIKLSDFKGIEVQAPKTREAVINPDCGYRFTARQSDFGKIPGSPIAYWVSNSFLKMFSTGILLGKLADSKQGLATADNNRFVRIWYEVDKRNIKFDAINIKESISSGAKWFPYNKGGDYRKWYGNNDYIVNWENNGFEIRNFVDEKGKLRSRPQNTDYYFRESVSWSLVSSSSAAFRYKPYGHIFDVAGMSFFSDDNLYYLLALCNTKIAMEVLKVIAPTINYQCGDIANIPVIMSYTYKGEIEDIVRQNINISKSDWDSFETSWDFQHHPLVRSGLTISKAYSLWENECADRFNKLKTNEKELNRVFIEIYGLQDELIPEEEDKDVSVLKADLQRDVKSLISYAVGCMFGRYSLDVDGIAYAGGEWDASKYRSYQPDYNGILPICDDEYFTDDIVGHFVDFIRTVYGEDTLEENLQFIADALGGSGSAREVIRKYFLNDFYKDHCKIYQKRPIYWMFDSGKKNGFKCLIYLHRYRPDTIARIRTDYVHEQQARYRTAISELNNRITGASTSEGIKLNKTLAKLQEQADELIGYEEKIHHLADQFIDIDLDDGVKVNYAKFQDVLAKIK